MVMDIPQRGIRFLVNICFLEFLIPKESKKRWYRKIQHHSYLIASTGESWAALRAG
jgi:hypothetical protein